MESGFYSSLVNMIAKLGIPISINLEEFAKDKDKDKDKDSTGNEYSQEYNKDNEQDN